MAFQTNFASEQLHPSVFCNTHAAEGNAAFSLTNFEEALRYYTEALAALKAVEAPRDPIIFLNRSAAYIGLKRYRKLFVHHADAIAIDDDSHC